MTYEQYELVQSIYEGARSFLFLMAIVSSMILFFMKSRKGQKICLYTAVWLLGFHLSGAFFQVRYFFGMFSASHIALRTRWLASEWYFWDKYIYAGIFLGVGVGISGYRIFRREKRAGESQNEDDEWKAVQLVKSSSSMFRIRTIVSVLIASFLSIVMMGFARQIVVERYAYGMPIELPEMAYGKLISFDYENYEHITFVIGKDGCISSADGRYSLDEFERFIYHLLYEKETYHEWMINADKEMVREEFIDGLIVHLRVDVSCAFGDVQRVLDVLRERRIRYGYFTVAEE